MKSAMFSTLPMLVQRVLCTLYVYLALLWDFVIVWVVQTAYMAATYPFTTAEQRANACGHIFRFISYLIIDALNPFWHVHVLSEFPRGLNGEPDKPTRKIILMMNHLSSADPFLAIRAFLPRDGTWIAKAVLFRVPFGGWAMGNADDLPVYFKDKHKHAAAGGAASVKPGSSGADIAEDKFANSFELVPGTAGVMLERARAKLRRGRMLCVFPEGTRSEHADRYHYLEPFRQGFFDLAVEEGALIVPLAISGTNRAWPRGSVLMSPADCYMSYGDVIDAGEYTNAEKLAAHVREVLISLRERHPDRQAQLTHRSKQRKDDL